MFSWLKEKIKAEIADESPMPWEEASQTGSILSDQMQVGFPMYASYTSKTRRLVNEGTYHGIKNCLWLMSRGKIYTTQIEIADEFGVSAVTVSLINKASSFKRYKQLRREHSKPKKYLVDFNPNLK